MAFPVNIPPGVLDDVLGPPSDVDESDGSDADHTDDELYDTRRTWQRGNVLVLTGVDRDFVGMIKNGFHATAATIQ